MPTALPEIHAPFTEKQPVVILNPLFEVEVADDVMRRLPPEIVSPPADASPTVELIPPEKVEVAAEVERIFPPDITNPFVVERPVVESPASEEVALPVTERNAVERLVVEAVIASSFVA